MTLSPLAKKLLIKPGFRVAVVNAPAGYVASLRPLPEGATVSDRPGKAMDMVQLFAADLAALEKAIVVAATAVKPGGLLWVCYPKGGQKVGTDINRDILREAMGDRGLVGVTLLSVDARWSAMRFRPPAEVGK